MDDTPYEDRTNTPNFSSSGRSCVAGEADTCTADGETDDVYNIMTYSWCSNVPSRPGGGGDEHFTDGQMDLMCSTYEIYRVEVDVTEYCHLWYELTFDNNPEDVGLFVENNGHYYEEFQPPFFSAYPGTTWISYDNGSGTGSVSYLYEGTGVSYTERFFRDLFLVSCI